MLYVLAIKWMEHLAIPIITPQDGKKRFLEDYSASRVDSSRKSRGMFTGSRDLVSGRLSSSSFPAHLVRRWMRLVTWWPFVVLIGRWKYLVTSLAK